MALNGKTVYIAGGCGTVGSGMARQFLLNGAQVAVSSRSQERLDEFKKNLDKSLHGKIILIKADASTEAGSECVLAELKKRGGVQHVFATVGGWEVAGPLTKQSVAKFDKEIAERARPHFIIAKTFLPYLANIEGSTYTFISGISAEKCDFPDMAMLVVCGGCQYGISEAARAEFRDSKVAVSEVRMGLFIQPKLEKDIKDKTTNVMGGKVLDVIGHDTLGDFMLEVVIQGRPRDVIRFMSKAEMNVYRKH